MRRVLRVPEPAGALPAPRCRRAQHGAGRAGAQPQDQLSNVPPAQAVQQRFSEEQAALHAEAEARRAAHRRRRRRRWHPQSFLLLRLVGEQHRRGQPEQLDQARETSVPPKYISSGLGLLVKHFCMLTLIPNALLPEQLDQVRQANISSSPQVHRQCRFMPYMRSLLPVPGQQG